MLADERIERLLLAGQRPLADALGHDVHDHDLGLKALAEVAGEAYRQLGVGTAADRDQDRRHLVQAALLDDGDVARRLANHLVDGRPYVIVARAEVHDARAQDETAVQDGVRREHPAVHLDLAHEPLVQPVEIRVPFGRPRGPSSVAEVLGHVPEAGDRERGLRRHGLELRPPDHAPVQIARELDVVLDPAAVRAPAVRQQRDPHLERRESARELRAVFHEVGAAAGQLLVLVDVARMDLVRLRQPPLVAHDHRARRRRDVQPLVGIEGDRVRALDPTERGPQRGHERRDPAVGGIHMEPEPVFLADVGDLLQRIDRARRHGPRRRHDDDRSRAGSEVLLDGPAERVDAHPELSVDRHFSHGASAEPHHVGGALVDDVRLGRGVDRQRRTRGDPLLARVPTGLRVAGGLQRDEVRHGPTGHDQPARSRRQPEDVREPAHELELDLGRGGRERPATDVHVHPGREQVGHRAGDRAGPGHVGDEPGVSRVDRPFEQRRAQEREQLVGRHRLVGNLHRHRRADLLGRVPA